MTTHMHHKTRVFPDEMHVHQHVELPPLEGHHRDDLHGHTHDTVHIDPSMPGFGRKNLMSCPWCEFVGQSMPDLHNHYLLNHETHIERHVKPTHNRAHRPEAFHSLRNGKARVDVRIQRAKDEFAANGGLKGNMKVASKKTLRTATYIASGNAFMDGADKLAQGADKAVDAVFPCVYSIKTAAKSSWAQFKRWLLDETPNQSYRA
jgi:hypothetical protein